MPKHEVYLLRKIRTYKKLKCPIKKGSLILPKKDQETSPSVSPDCIWEEEKSRWKFWRNPKRIILLFEGNMKPISIHEGDLATINMGFLNLDEIVDAIKKAIILAISKVKPLKTELFLILAVLGIIGIVVNVITLLKILSLSA